LLYGSLPFFEDTCRSAALFQACLLREWGPAVEQEEAGRVQGLPTPHEHCCLSGAYGEGSIPPGAFCREGLCSLPAKSTCWTACPLQLGLEIIGRLFNMQVAGVASCATWWQGPVSMSCLGPFGAGEQYTRCAWQGPTMVLAFQAHLLGSSPYPSGHYHGLKAACAACSWWWCACNMLKVMCPMPAGTVDRGKFCRRCHSQAWF
jgi:hypothetical protein